MLYIKHRINTVKDLRTVPSHMGIEVDIRYKEEKLILQHDAFKGGELFEDLLKEYNHAFIVLNVKSEGIEDEIITVIRKYKIKDYFFLDLSFPAIIKLVSCAEKNIAVRFSEYEPLEQALAMKNKVNWVWIDCFNKFVLDDRSYSELKKYFRICLVSPELQKHPASKIAEFRNLITEYSIDAVCTKEPDLWK